MNAPLTGFTVDDLTKAAQRRAADPRLSAWVSANAGAGKTKVLTDRVLRLLLDGAPPGRILPPGKSALSYLNNCRCL